MNPPNNPAPAQPDSEPLKTDIVANIPIHTGAVPTPKAHDELDQIMQDVGKELKKDDKAPHKRHLFGHKNKPAAQNPPVHPVQPHPAPVATHKAEPKPLAKPKPKKSAPVFIIVTAIAVTSVLIAAAFAAYR